MLGKFWDKYRYLVEVTAFVTALAGIFLAIPDPEQEAARNALLNLRFVWLFLTTLAIGSLIVVLLMHVQTERVKNMRDAFFVAKGSLSLLIMLLGVILLSNL